MIDLRPLSDIGAANHGWLDARHHFSFADYHRPDRMGWGTLRVWNDDSIAPGAGFPPHPHRDMEIITYVRSGAITHEDSLGNRGRTAAGDVQVMSAGTGILHSEYNLENEPTTLFQIWIIPATSGARPSWGTRPFPRVDRAGRFVALASGFADEISAAGALPIRTPSRVSGAILKAGQALDHDFDLGRLAYLVAASGAVTVNGVVAAARDGVAIADVDTIRVEAISDTELVLVDVPA